MEGDSVIHSIKWQLAFHRSNTPVTTGIRGTGRRKLLLHGMSTLHEYSCKILKLWGKKSHILLNKKLCELNSA